MFHRSPRLLLRPVWPEDWQAIHRGIADEGVVRNLARAPWPYSEADAREFAARPADPLLPSFLVTRAADGVVIGSAGLGVAPSEGRAANDSGILADGPAELGYWIARAHWGRGYATEAGAAVIAVAGMLGHRALVASHFLDNPASGAVLRKLGFEPTGTVAERFSCGRGEAAPVREFRRELAARGAGQQRAA